MLSLIVIIASTNHLLNTKKAVSRIENSSMGFIVNILGTPGIAVILSGIVMLVAGILLLIYFKNKSSFTSINSHFNSYYINYTGWKSNNASATFF